MNYTATLRKMLPPRDGLCGTLWDICPRLLLMSLCCRWWTSWWTSSVSSIRCVLLPSRLSTCPRSLWRTSLRDACVVSHSWWNSWWKCRRLFPFLRFSRLWSSSSTFQFLVVEAPFLVFKVFFPDRAQQHHPRPPRNAFLSGLWSRSFVFPVKAFKIFVQDRFRQRLRLFNLLLVQTMTRMSLVMGFFALFPKEKSAECRAGQCGPAPARQLMDPGGL